MFHIRIVSLRYTANFVQNKAIPIFINIERIHSVCIGWLALNMQSKPCVITKNLQEYYCFQYKLCYNFHSSRLLFSIRLFVIVFCLFYLHFSSFLFLFFSNLLRACFLLLLFHSRSPRVFTLTPFRLHLPFSIWIFFLFPPLCLSHFCSTHLPPFSLLHPDSSHPPPIPLFPSPWLFLLSPLSSSSLPALLVLIHLKASSVIILTRRNLYV